MIEETKRMIESEGLAVKLYDAWVRERQKRPDIQCTNNRKEVEEIRRKNSVNQRVKPRQRHLQQLKRVAKAMTTADKVALLVTLELPVLETSALLHRLSRQLAADPEAKYFSPENMFASCGCGCG